VKGTVNNECKSGLPAVLMIPSPISREKERERVFLSQKNYNRNIFKQHRNINKHRFFSQVLKLFCFNLISLRA
jgi:hypothetical protein